MFRAAYRFVALLLAAALLGACAPAAPTAAPTETQAAPTATAEMMATEIAEPTTASTEAPTDAPTEAPTEAPTDTPEPVMLETMVPAATLAPLPAGFVVPDRNTVLRSGRSYARTFIDPGAVIYHDGLFHMFFNGIDGYPRPVQVGYAVSPDGVNWTVYEDGPVLDARVPAVENGANGVNLFVTSGLVEDDGTWVLYYYTLSGVGFDGRQTVGRATAPGPLGPWTRENDAVLLPGSRGAWDDRQVSAPDVLRTEDGYVMYYDGRDSVASHSSIGMATSPDGIHWTKYDDPATTDAAFAESDPVFTPTPGAWDEVRMVDPNVEREGNHWVMFYASSNGNNKFNGTLFGLGVATSPDGIAWTPAPGNPFLSSDDPRTAGPIYLVSVAKAGEDYYIFHDQGTGTATNVKLVTHGGPIVP